MEITEIKIVGQIRFGGSTHALDNHGITFCGTESREGRLFNDTLAVRMDQVTCRRCLAKFAVINRIEGRETHDERKV